jgi:hypothetical protein
MKRKRGSPLSPLCVASASACLSAGRFSLRTGHTNQRLSLVKHKFDVKNEDNNNRNGWEVSTLGALSLSFAFALLCRPFMFTQLTHTHTGCIFFHLILPHFSLRLVLTLSLECAFLSSSLPLLSDDKHNSSSTHVQVERKNVN